MKHVKRPGKVARALQAVQEIAGDSTVEIDWIRASWSCPVIWVVFLTDGRVAHIRQPGFETHFRGERCCELGDIRYSCEA